MYSENVFSEYLRLPNEWLKFEFSRGHNFGCLETSLSLIINLYGMKYFRSKHLDNKTVKGHSEASS